METVYEPIDPNRSCGFEAFLVATDFALWDVLVGPTEDKNNSYADGLTRDGRPYYLSHFLYKTEGSANKCMAFAIELHTDAEAARTLVIQKS